MRLGFRQWTVLALLFSVTSLATKPALAQPTPSVTASPTTPQQQQQQAQQQPYAYPPPQQQQQPPAYPPPAYPPPAYPPAPYPPAPYPYAAPYPQYAPPPSGPPVMVHRARTGFLVGGLVTFGVTWGLALLVSSVQSDNTNNGGYCDDSCHATSRYFWIPVGGPLLAESSVSGAGGGTSFAALWSLAEAAGVVMTIVGLIGHDVPEYGYGPRRRAMWNVVPTAGRDSRGLALHATF
jgi:hypothetical protein